jgi:hypothetical protein
VLSSPLFGALPSKLFGALHATVADFDEKRAYAGTMDHKGLRWFVSEEVLPRDLLRHALRDGSTRWTTAVWALVAAEDAEAIRADLSAGRPRAVCDRLLNRAVELLPLTSGAPELADGATS